MKPLLLRIRESKEFVFKTKFFRGVPFFIRVSKKIYKYFESSKKNKIFMLLSKESLFQCFECPFIVLSCFEGYYESYSFQ